MTKKIKLGISACLLGEKVRYDGTDKLDPYLVETLGRYVEFVPVCPEVGFGLGIPREPMRLMGDPSDPRLETINTQIDYTEGMKGWAEAKVRELEPEGLRGFVFKARSPSCGLKVDVFDDGGEAAGSGAGLFARAFRERFPHLPVEDEEGMRDQTLREEFMGRATGPQPRRRT